MQPSTIETPFGLSFPRTAAIWAGNFAKTESVPVQMRTPEDIPNAVFAAAGVHRDLSRTVFSSQGPVKWSTEHYKDGEVQKPEVCAFNHGIPKLMMDGTVRPLAPETK